MQRATLRRTVDPECPGSGDSVEAAVKVDQAASRWDFSDLRAIFLTCTLKKSPEMSHTEGLWEICKAIFEKNGVQVDELRVIDHQVAFGVWGDMTEHGDERDDWPQIYARVKAANIVVIGSSIWLGEKTSVCTMLIERLYANSHLLNEQRAASVRRRHGKRTSDCRGTVKLRTQREARPAMADDCVGPRLDVPTPSIRSVRAHASARHLDHHVFVAEMRPVARNRTKHVVSRFLKGHIGHPSVVGRHFRQDVRR